MQATPELAAVDHDLTHLLSSWFNRGFLELRRIDWSTPAAVLREADRIRGGARDPRLPGPEAPPRARPPLLRLLPSRAAGEPLIFVEVAFVDELPSDVGRSSRSRARWATAPRALRGVLLDHELPGGAEGISFGNFLIKQVARTCRPSCPT
jgi:malonyl-CoA decarboxylase